MGCFTSKNTHDLQNCTIENTQELLPIGKIPCRVLRVVDGDTLVICFRFNGVIYRDKLRLYGVNCPETRTRNIEEKKLGLDAKKFTEETLAGKMIYVDFAQKRDKYGRLLGTPFVNGQNFCEMLIAENHACKYMIP